MPEYYEPADPARVFPRWLAITAVVLGVLMLGAYLMWRSGLEEGAEAVPEPQNIVAEAQPIPQAAQPAPSSAAGQPVTLTARAQVWLRVSEQGGGTIEERTFAAGETYQVPATARQPVLRVGAPEALRVTVGQTEIPQLGPSGQPVGNVSLRAEELVARAGAAPAPAR